MTNPMFNPQPNYSGVTIQIANPAVNVSQYPYGAANVNCRVPNINGYGDSRYSEINGISSPTDAYLLQNRTAQHGNFIAYPQGSYGAYPQNTEMQDKVVGGMQPVDYKTSQFTGEQYGVTNPMSESNQLGAYPAQYYLNNYNYGVNGNGNGMPSVDGVQDKKQISGKIFQQDGTNSNAYSFTNQDASLNKNLKNSEELSFDSEKDLNQDGNSNVNNFADNKAGENSNSMNSYKMYAKSNEPKDTDMTRSKNIIGDLDEREAEIQEEKKNTKETKIVALTDEYIKSLENYLNNPNDEIRLMASKEILTRLDEDKDRYNDAALNALLNKMLQDPSKLVRIASLSAFASQLASGNDYTVQLLHNIQANPNSDKEDVLQAADILLKMSSGVEVKNIPNPSVKENNK